MDHSTTFAVKITYLTASTRATTPVSKTMLAVSDDESRELKI